MNSVHEAAGAQCNLCTEATAARDLMSGEMFLGSGKNEPTITAQSHWPSYLPIEKIRDRRVFAIAMQKVAQVFANADTREFAS